MRRDLQDKMYEERAAKLAEIEYQRRINNEKQANQTLLSTWKGTVNQHWEHAFWIRDAVNIALNT